MNKLNVLALIVSLFLIGGTGNLYAQDDEYVFSKAELDQILAPVALYPDTLLSHILVAATYPLEVVRAERWSKDNGRLEGDAALSAVESQDWAPSVKALAAFPRVLEKMSEDLEWTQKIGDAFLQDEELVLASVQDLRQRAYDEGSLDHLDHVEVVEDDSDNIVIESKEKDVVYVPYYDTRVVYGNWWWHDYPPVYWSGLHSHISFHWGPRIFVGTGIYFSSFHWRNRHVVVIDRRHRQRNRFYSGRHVSRHVDSRRWAHNPRHRRGVYYRSASVRDRHVQRRVRRDSSRTNADSVGRRLRERRDTSATRRDMNRTPRSVKNSDRASRKLVSNVDRRNVSLSRSSNSARQNDKQRNAQSRDSNKKSVRNSRQANGSVINKSAPVKTSKQKQDYRQEKNKSKSSSNDRHKASTRTSAKASRTGSKNMRASRDSKSSRTRNESRNR